MDEPHQSMVAQNALKRLRPGATILLGEKRKQQQFLILTLVNLNPQLPLIPGLPRPGRECRREFSIPNPFIPLPKYSFPYMLRARVKKGN